MNGTKITYIVNILLFITSIYFFNKVALAASAIIFVILSTEASILEAINKDKQ